MHFKSREEAALLLLDKLKTYKGQNPLVLGIPRGAVPMAATIAKGLEGELGVVLVHKIPAPENPEYAIGSIGLSGKIQSSSFVTGSISESYLKTESDKQWAILKERQKKYHLKETNYKDRIVIIVDDGIATGATTIAAIEEVRYYKPKKIIIATPVVAFDTVPKIQKLADELVALEIPEYFYAVGQYYDDFRQISDEEVIQCLQLNE